MISITTFKNALNGNLAEQAEIGKAYVELVREQGNVTVEEMQKHFNLSEDDCLAIAETNTNFKEIQNYIIDFCKAIEDGTIEVSEIKQVPKIGSIRKYFKANKLPDGLKFDEHSCSNPAFEWREIRVPHALTEYAITNRFSLCYLAGRYVLTNLLHKWADTYVKYSEYEQMTIKTLPLISKYASITPHGLITCCWQYELIVVKNTDSPACRRLTMSELTKVYTTLNLIDQEFAGRIATLKTIKY